MFSVIFKFLQVVKFHHVSWVSKLTHTRSGVDLKCRKWGLTWFRFCLFLCIILYTLLIFKKILDWCRRVWRGLGTGSGIWTRLWPGLSATVATLTCFHCIHTGLPCKFVVSLHHLCNRLPFSIHFLIGDAHIFVSYLVMVLSRDGYFFLTHVFTQKPLSSIWPWCTPLHILTFKN